MRRVGLAMIVACCGGSTAAVDAGTDTGTQMMCWVDQRTMQDRACTQSSDCVVLAYQSDCCGSVIQQGIRADRLDAVHNAEVTGDTGCPICKCAPKPTIDDTGLMGTVFIAKCDSNVCTSHAQ